MTTKTKKRFKVYARSDCYYTIEVEAENAEEAIRIAEDTDGGEFDECESNDYAWNIERAEELDYDE